MEQEQYDVFISYSRKDTAIADEICKAFDLAGISYFIDRKGLPGGFEFPEELAKAILNSDIMLFLASNNSYSSKFTNNEITFAFNEKEKGSILPYIIDESQLPITLRFIFAGVNIRNIKEHPISSILVDDILQLLGKDRRPSKDFPNSVNQENTSASQEKEQLLFDLGLSQGEEVSPLNSADTIIPDFSLDTLPTSDYYWEKFVDEIINGNIIPVIGVDFLVAPISRKGVKENIHQQIISFISQKTGITNSPQSFSQLMADVNFQRAVKDKNLIHHLVYQIISSIDKINEIEHTPSKYLTHLLESKRFPFVISTSFTPIVEKSMEQIWSNETVKVLKYCPDPHVNEDIVSTKAFSKPTVFYIYGRFSDWSYVKFALTDTQIMNYCKCWIKGYGTPKKIENMIKDKYLLFVGHDSELVGDSFLWEYERNTSK